MGMADTDNIPMENIEAGNNQEERVLPDNVIAFPGGERVKKEIEKTIKQMFFENLQQNSCISDLQERFSLEVKGLLRQYTLSTSFFYDDTKNIKDIYKTLKSKTLGSQSERDFLALYTCMFFSQKEGLKNYDPQKRDEFLHKFLPRFDLSNQEGKLLFYIVQESILDELDDFDELKSFFATLSEKKDFLKKDEAFQSIIIKSLFKIAESEVPLSELVYFLKIGEQHIDDLDIEPFMKHMQKNYNDDIELFQFFHLWEEIIDPRNRHFSFYDIFHDLSISLMKEKSIEIILPLLGQSLPPKIFHEVIEAFVSESLSIKQFMDQIIPSLFLKETGSSEKMFLYQFVHDYIISEKRSKDNLKYIKAELKNMQMAGKIAHLGGLRMMTQEEGDFLGRNIVLTSDKMYEKSDFIESIVLLIEKYFPFIYKIFW